MRRVTLSLVAVFVLSLLPAFGEGSEASKLKHLGTPITSENVVDILEIQRVVSNLSDAADSQRWDEVRDLFADKVDTTIGEAEPGVSRMKAADEIAARWEGFFNNAEEFVMHHVTSNERVFFDDADNATVFSKGVIALENRPAGEFAESGGTLRGVRWVSYTHGVTRTADGWKVNKLLVDYIVENFDSLKP